MTTAIKIIDLKNFPIEKTFFWLLQDKEKRQELVKKEIESWKARFPSAETAINKYLTKYGVEVPDKDGDKAILNYFYSFDIENDILNGAKPDTSQKINKLLNKKSDDDIVELVRIIAKEQQGDLESEIKNWKIGVMGLVFLLESVEKYYLKDLPEYIKGKLEVVEPVALNELNQEKLKASVSNIFATLYAGFTSTEKQEDFNGFQEGINTELGNIKTLIEETRKTKQPIEPDKPAVDTEALNNELKELYAYIDGLLDRQSQRPVYILTEEPESMTRTGKINPNYEDFEEELKNRLLIKGKLQEKINKRKFSTPIEISKEKHPADQLKPANLPTNWEEQLKEREKLLDKVKELEKTLESRPADQQHPDYETIKAERDKLLEKITELNKQLENNKPVDQQPQPSNEQINKANQYDNIASIFPNGKIPDNLKELWSNLNQRPNITQEELNNLKNQLEQQGIKPEELKLLLKDNWEYLKGHIDILTNIIKRAVPVSTPNLSGGSSSSTTSESKPSSSEKPKENKSDQISQ